MDVLINTANNVAGPEGLKKVLEETVRSRLSRFEGRLTRVEVHVGDETERKDFGDKRCLVEARPAGRDPVSVTDHADSVEQATSRALAKLVTALERDFGKITNRKGH